MTEARQPTRGTQRKRKSEMLGACVDCGGACSTKSVRCSSCFQGRAKTTEWRIAAALKAGRTSAAKRNAERVARDATADETGERICPRCKESKPVADFPMWRKHRDGTPRYSYCRPCKSIASRETNMYRKFGLLPGEYETALSAQGGSCAICHRPPIRNRLAVDHDHKTGQSRGLLCMRCNRLLGWVYDQPDVLTAAAAYLKNPPMEAAVGREVVGRTGRVTMKRRKHRAK